MTADVWTPQAPTLIRSTTVIGYVADADHWCPSCAADIYAHAPGTDTVPEGTLDHEGNPLSAMFGDTECDYPMVCSGCLEELPTVLTEHGQQEWAESLARNRERAAAALRVYATALKKYQQVPGVKFDGEGEHLADAEDELTRNPHAADLLEEWLNVTRDGQRVVLAGGSLVSALYYAKHQTALRYVGYCQCSICAREDDAAHVAESEPETLPGPDKLAFDGETPPAPNCPNPPLYHQHYLEINLWQMGESWDWRPLLEVLSFEHPSQLVGQIIAAAPEGWEVSGWEEHPHKDANGILAVFFTGGDCPSCGDPKPATAHCYKCGQDVDTEPTGEGETRLVLHNRKRGHPCPGSWSRIRST